MHIGTCRCASRISTCLSKPAHTAPVRCCSLATAVQSAIMMFSKAGCVITKVPFKAALARLLVLPASPESALSVPTLFRLLVANNKMPVPVNREHRTAHRHAPCSAAFDAGFIHVPSVPRLSQLMAHHAAPRHTVTLPPRALLRRCAAGPARAQRAVAHHTERVAGPHAALPQHHVCWLPGLDPGAAAHRPPAAHHAPRPGPLAMATVPGPGLRQAGTAMPSFACGHLFAAVKLHPQLADSRCCCETCTSNVASRCSCVTHTSRLTVALLDCRPFLVNP